MTQLLTPQRLQRLREIAQDEGAVLLDDPSKLTPPVQRTSFRVPDDDRKADAILGQLRLEGAQTRPQPSTFKRAFSSGKKVETAYTEKELHAALTRVIDDNGLAGVAEVLLNRVNAIGGNPNFSRRASTGLVKKIRNTDSQDERGRLLQTATELARPEFVLLLAPFADSLSLDESLQIALRIRHLGIIETLLKYGANATLYQTVFQSAAKNGDFDILGLFLRASKQFSAQHVTNCLLPATIFGSLKAVLLLMRAGADGDYDNASALMCAIQTGRTDLTVAIVMGPNSPSSKSLNTALDNIFSGSTRNLNDRHLLVEVLLCGGPTGNAVNDGLYKSTFLANEEMMQLLLEYGADINHNNAGAVGYAIQRSRNDLVGNLLRSQTLRSEYASEVVERISRNAPSQIKVGILSMLLVHGASGHHCNELLVTASELDDIDTAHLLVSYGKDQNQPPVASVDYESGRCLQIAVSNGNLPLLKILAFDGTPSKFSLSKALSFVPQDNEELQFLFTKALMQAGAEGPEVDDAFHAAVMGQQRSPRLVELFVRSGVRVNGRTLISVVTQGSVDILKVLLSGNSSPATCSAAITIAMKNHSKATRYNIIRLLLPIATSAGPESSEIAQAVIEVLQNSLEDGQLLTLLCKEGKANINFKQGQAVVLATGQNLATFDTVMNSSGPSPTSATIARALGCAMDLPPTDSSRHRKVQTLLRVGRPQEALNHALVQEIRGALTMKRDLTVLQALLAAGADVDFAEGEPVCHAVRDPAIMDLILARRPSPLSLSMAFPLAMAMPEPTRYSLCEKLLMAGAVGPELDKALCVSVKEGPPALPLINLLLSRSDVNYCDGRALRLAVRRVFREGLDLLLSQRPVMPTVATRIRSFQEAMVIHGQKDRFDIVKKLLDAGTKGEAILSEALINAVNLKDLPLIKLLLQSGASVDFNAGQAVHSAASLGNIDILEAMVEGKHAAKPNLSTLTAGFGGAMFLKEKNMVSYHSILQTLLAAGMKGEAVDAALVEAVKDGDSNIQLTGLLYNHGAAIEWHEGEAINIAARSAFIDTLSLLLSGKPSQNSMKRAYRSSLLLQKDRRYLVIKKILEAGKAIDKHVTNTLFKATHENPPDRPLIKLLLDHQVFDEGGSMAHAADVLDLETLVILTGSSKAKQYVSPVFRDVMATGKPWQSNKGMAIIELLLERGATGDAVGDSFVNVVERCESPADTLANDFLDLLIRFQADVNYQRGLPLQRAAQQANVGLVQKLIHGATADSKAMAIYYLFTSSSDEVSILQMIAAFTDAVDSEQRLDINFKHPDSELEPVLFMALNKFPRKTKVLQALLNTGFSPNQWQNYEIDTEFGDEPLTVLCWALSQPEKKISSANIELLIDHGANVNFTSKSGINAVALSIKNQRPDILEKLISKGAKVTQASSNGITPLALASQVGNSAVMAQLLKAGAEIDDGSLHDAARELRCDAMRVLIRYNHEVDFPSDRHDGRSALAELCFKAVDNGPNPAMEEAVECLVANGSDVRLRNVGGKTIFHYALDSSDPLAIMRVLLKLLWKVINDDCFLYDDGKYTYSLTKYVEKGLSLGPQVQRQEIVQLLHQKRAIDKFWANDVDEPQPQGFCGAPQHIVDEVNHQKARARRMSEQRQDLLQELELKRLTVVEENKLLRERTDAEIRVELEKARMQDQIYETRANQQFRLDNRAELERQRMLGLKQSSELSHVKAIGDTQINIQRRIGEVKIQNDQTEHMLAIEFVEARIEKENQGVQARLAIEGTGREDAERVQMRMHEREMARLKTQKTLVDSSTALAKNLRSSGMNQRQIGYITGEVN